MASTFQVRFDGTPADEDFYAQMTMLEVEESVDMPGAFELTLPVSRSAEGDLTHVNDDAYQPYAKVAVVVTADGEAPECIFDGYVLAQKLHLETGTQSSTLRVWGQDASWLMNLEEKAREWAEVTDGAAANTIFGEYGFTPAAGNTDDDSGGHAETGNTLYQRSTDIQFLRMLARRSGKIARVACQNAPGVYTGYFVRPAADAAPAVVMPLNDPEAWAVDALDFEWDIARPTEAAANQALFDSDEETGAQAEESDSGLAPLDERTLAAFAGRPFKARLTAAAFDAADLSARLQALLGEAGWFARCEGEADLSRVGKVLRAGTVVQINGAGSVHSGKYLVWSVRHTISQDAHKMKFVLKRNAVGPAPVSGGGGLF